MSNSSNKLKFYFPLLRTRQEILAQLHANPALLSLFHSWTPKQQEEFLDFSAEASLLITDIVVELEDNSLANVEIQKIGYAFPGERCACYSSDLLLRQYKQVRGKKGKQFSYRDIKSIYLIVIYEESPNELLAFPDTFIHHGEVAFTSGLKMNLLQKYTFISLDIFQKLRHNEPISTIQDAWLTFLSSDEPDKIIELITVFPEFRTLYETIYQMCRNLEDVMGFFSEELRELDRNTVYYMIDSLKQEVKDKNDQLAALKAKIADSETEFADINAKIADKNTELADKDAKIADKDAEIARLTKIIENMQHSV